jgi:hypothetical protein
MITSACIVEQISRLGAVYKDLGPPPANAKEPSLWRELAQVLKGCETESQAIDAIDTLIAQPERTFCPKPGELAAMIDQTSTGLQEKELDWLKPVQCWTCRDTGIITVPNESFHEVGWCSCQYGQAEANADPGFVIEYNTKAEALAKRLRQHPKRRQRSGSMARAAQILGGKLT